MGVVLVVMGKTGLSHFYFHPSSPTHNCLWGGIRSSMTRFLLRVGSVALLPNSRSDRISPPIIFSGVGSLAPYSVIKGFFFLLKDLANAAGH